MIIVSLLTCSLWLFSPKVGLMGQRVGFTVCCDLPGSAAPFCKKSVLRELTCRPRFAQTEHSEEHVIMLKHLHDTLGKREGLVASLIGPLGELLSVTECNVLSTVPTRACGLAQALNKQQRACHTFWGHPNFCSKPPARNQKGEIKDVDFGKADSVIIRRQRDLLPRKSKRINRKSRGLDQVQGKHKCQ